MIERYTLPEMGRVWSDQHKYELWCQVEVLVLAEQAAAGIIPASAVEPVRNAPPPTPEAVAAIEKVTDHDVIAFLTAWADNTMPREAAAYVHYGMTSSDLLDTALALQLTQATDILLTKADRLVAVLRDHALAHRDTLRDGREVRLARGGRRGPARWRVATRGGRGGRTGSTRSRIPGGTGWRTSRSRWRAAGTGSPAPGRPSPSARCPARSAATPTSTRPSRPPSCRNSACTRRMWPPRSLCATGSRNGSAGWPSSAPSARRSPWRCGTVSGPSCASSPSRSASARRALRRCRTRRTRSGPSGSPGWRDCCAAM